MSSQPDYLFEDPPVNNQKFVCISVLTPKNFKEETTMHTLKVRGSYDSYDDAKKRADFLRNIDPNINVYVGEVGKWLPFEDNPENAKDHDYQNKRLNNMMKGYLENQEKAKEFHEQRKNDMIMRSLKENEEKEKRRLARDERRKNGEEVDDDAEELAFSRESTQDNSNITKLEDSNMNKDSSVLPASSGSSGSSGPSESSRPSIQGSEITKPIVLKESDIKEKEKEIKEKEQNIKNDKDDLQKTREEYNKYQQKTEKVRKELEEAKKIYESMLAAGMKK
jgi:hypothetical protein